MSEAAVKLVLLLLLALALAVALEAIAAWWSYRILGEPEEVSC